MSRVSVRRAAARLTCLLVVAGACTSGPPTPPGASSSPSAARWTLMMTLTIPGTGGNVQRFEYRSAFLVDGGRVLQEGEGTGTIGGTSQCRERGRRVGPRQRWSGTFRFGLGGSHADGGFRLQVAGGAVDAAIRPRNPDRLCQRLVEDHAEVAGRLAELRDIVLEVPENDEVTIPVPAGGLRAELRASTSTP